MSELLNNFESLEETLSPEVTNNQIEMYQQAMQEAINEGANDMAAQYQSKIEALQAEQQALPGQEISFKGGLLSESRYLEYAEKELERNGATYEYNQLIEKAHDACVEEMQQEAKKKADAENS